MPCLNNLRQIDAAATEFALDKGRTSGSSISYPTDLTPFIKLNASSSIPPCPAGGIYSDPTVGWPPSCSLGNAVTPGHYMNLSVAN